MARETSWRLNGRSVGRSEIAEELALARQSKAKRAQAERDARERDSEARAVGAALRRGDGSGGRTISCTPRPVRGTSNAAAKLQRFGRMLFDERVRRSYIDARGFSSFHFKLSPRGLGNLRRPYRRGEAVVAIRYIMREAAAEITGGGIVSNISLDPDEIAALFNALEELELIGGRANANVYTKLVVSLPHELECSDRLTLFEKVCEYLNELGIPYAGRLHAPDPEGDQRNFHGHVIFSWRPFSREVDGYRFTTDTLGALNQTEFAKSFRRHAAECMNAAMAAAGHERRFTPGQLERAPGEVAPGAPKIGPGPKHAQRRQQAIANGQTERAMLAERLQAMGELQKEVQAVSITPRVPREPIMAALDRREAEIIGTEVAAAAVATQAVPVTSEVVAIPATEPGAGTIIEVEVRPPVSHEKPSIVPATGTLPASDVVRARLARAGHLMDGHSKVTQPNLPLSKRTLHNMQSIAGHRRVDDRAFATSNRPAGVVTAADLIDATVSREPARLAPTASVHTGNADPLAGKVAYQQHATGRPDHSEPSQRVASTPSASPAAQPEAMLPEIPVAIPANRPRQTLPPAARIDQRPDIIVATDTASSLMPKAAEREKTVGSVAKDAEANPALQSAPNRTDASPPSNSARPPSTPLPGTTVLGGATRSGTLSQSQRQFLDRRAVRDDAEHRRSAQRAKTKTQLLDARSRRDVSVGPPIIPGRKPISPDDAIAILSRSRFLPIKPLVDDGDGGRSLSLDLSQQVGKDSDDLAAIKAIETDARIQALYQENHEAFLSWLRTQWTERLEARPTIDQARSLITDEDAATALAAIEGSNSIETLTGETAAYWDDLEHRALMQQTFTSRNRRER